MDGKRVDELNIGLMIGAAALAFTLPFEVFLFSYAVLGPLHYITEIGWLHKKHYFTISKNDYWIFVVICFVLMVLYFLPDTDFFQTFSGTTKQAFQEARYYWFAHLVFIAFASAVVVCLVKNMWARIAIIGVSIVIAVALQRNSVYNLLFATLLTTMIHVWLFTGMFILSGAVKSKRTVGYVSFGVFILCSLSFLVFTPGVIQYASTDYVMTVFDKSTFDSVSRTIYGLISPGNESSLVLQSSIGLKIQGFMAFAYTYHYLNWFSKTSVIKWHQVPKKWLAISIAVWVAAVALYLVDYRIGLNALFFLSMLHVFLEFPLNYRTVVSLGGELFTRRRVSPARSSR